MYVQVICFAILLTCLLVYTVIIATTQILTQMTQIWPEEQKFPNTGAFRNLPLQKQYIN